MSEITLGKIFGRDGLSRLLDVLRTRFQNVSYRSDTLLFEKRYSGPLNVDRYVFRYLNGRLHYDLYGVTDSHKVLDVAPDAGSVRLEILRIVGILGDRDVPHSDGRDSACDLRNTAGDVPDR